MGKPILHNYTDSTFPSVLIFKDPPKFIDYEITSKHQPRSSPIFCVKIPLVRTKCFYHHRLAYYTASDPLGVKDTLSLGFAALDTRGLRRIRILTGGD